MTGPAMIIEVASGDVIYDEETDYYDCRQRLREWAFTHIRDVLQPGAQFPLTIIDKATGREYGPDGRLMDSK